MEAIKRNSEFRSEFKCRVHLIMCTLNGVSSFQPRENFCWRSEWVGTRSAECMPIGDSKTEMIFHRLLTYLLLGIVIFKSDRIVRILSLEFDFLNALEKLLLSCNYFHGFWGLYQI